MQGLDLDLEIKSKEMFLYYHLLGEGGWGYTNAGARDSLYPVKDMESKICLPQSSPETFSI